MKKLKTRTKTDAVVKTLFIILILVSYVISAITIRETPNSDDAITYISNSNGMRCENNWNNVQTLVNDLDGEGGDVYLTAHNFTATSTVYVNSSQQVNFIGVGKWGGLPWGNGINYSTVINVGADLPDGIIKYNGYVKNNSGTLSSKWINKPIIRNIGFHGGSDNSYDVYESVGLNFSTCMEPQIENCGFWYINGEGIYMNWTYMAITEDCMIKKCGNLTRNKPAVGLYPYDWTGTGALEWTGDVITKPVFNRCVFEPCPYAWIESTYTRDCVRRLTLKNCYMEASYTESDREPVYGVIPGIYAKFSGNDWHGYVNHSFIYVTHAKQHGGIVDGDHFRLGSGQDVIPAGQISIANADNWIISNCNLRESLRKAIFLGGTCHGHSLTGNQIISPDDYGLYTGGDGCSITGGNITGCGASGIYLDGDASTISGISISDCLVGVQIVGDRNSIASCIVSGNTNDGITFSTALNCSVNGNTVFNNGGVGINVANTCWNTTIIGNNCLGNTGTNINDQGHGTIKEHNME